MRGPRRNRSTTPVAAFTLPAHWSPSQALAVFECIELLRDQLWLAYGPEIQRACRAQLVTAPASPDPDTGTPF
jgi:hypothetical protein